MRHNPEFGGDYAHRPVLWREVLDFVSRSSIGGEGFMIDATLGEGGHSELLLDAFPGISIIAFERDPDILDVARVRLKKFGERIQFINDNFSRMASYLAAKEGQVGHMLFDFGISSFHYEKSGRGFAYSVDERLDMRLDGFSGHDAEYIVNTYREKELADLIYRYGEERWSRRIAAAICREREKNPIRTTSALAELVLKAIPARFHVRNIHPATRVFQALRIEVNDELGSIRTAMKNFWRFMTPGGRMMAISFHSLEDRIVKDAFRRLARGCVCDSEMKHCRCLNEPFIKILTKKPVMAGMEELQENSRSRSAKMRACERLSGGVPSGI